jgi:hypothetical protein
MEPQHTPEAEITGKEKYSKSNLKQCEEKAELLINSLNIRPI